VVLCPPPLTLCVCMAPTRMHGTPPHRCMLVRQALVITSDGTSNTTSVILAVLQVCGVGVRLRYTRSCWGSPTGIHGTPRTLCSSSSRSVGALCSSRSV
jgi:hypothetical protein